MNLFKKFFGKKKYDMSEEELVWKREGTDPNYPAQMETQQSQEPSRQDPSPVQHRPKAHTSGINSLAFNKGKYHIRKVSPKPQIDSFQQSYRTEQRSPRGQQHMDYNSYREPAEDFNYNKFDYEFQQKQMNQGSPRGHRNRVQTEPNQFSQSERVVNDPGLRDYYNIEESIMRKMMQAQEDKKRGSPRTNRGGYNTNLPTKPKQTRIKRTKPPLNPKMSQTRSIKGLKIRKTPVFKKVGPELDEKEEKVTMESKQDSSYMNKSLPELQQILQTRNNQLQGLEDHHQKLNHRDNNITILHKRLKELKAMSEKVREKNQHLETETTFLREEITNKKDKMNEVESRIRKIPKFSESENKEKKKLIHKIEGAQRGLEKISDKLNKYKNGDRKEVAEIEKNSEKNMNMELEEIKINIQNYDDELLKWLKYFDRKPLAEFEIINTAKTETSFF